MLRSLSHTHHWRKALMEDPIPAEWVTQLPAFLKHTSQEFLASVPPALSSLQHAALNRWYASTGGQDALGAFTRALWSQMAQIAPLAMPAHDARHAMYKVPAAALQYVVAEQVEGWERVGVVGALLHDHGRWAEERVFGFPDSSVVHARLSYLLGHELLEAYDMPLPVKQHILMAAIRHTTGAGPSDAMPLKLTVSADRDQLYGPEIILRNAHHVIGADGEGSSYYGERPGQTVLELLERYLTRRLPGPLFSRHSQVNRLWQILATFLLLSEAPTASRQRFERILAHRSDASEPLPPFDWRQAYETSRQHLTNSFSPADALDALLTAPHVAPAEKYCLEAHSKLSFVSEDNAPRLAAALRYAHQLREALDADEHVALARIAALNSGDALISGLCAQVLDQATVTNALRRAV
jgi:hypothetical protein